MKKMILAEGDTYRVSQKDNVNVVSCTTRTTREQWLKVYKCTAIFSPNGEKKGSKNIELSKGDFIVELNMKFDETMSLRNASLVDVAISEWTGMGIESLFSGCMPVRSGPCAYPEIVTFSGPLSDLFRNIIRDAIHHGIDDLLKKVGCILTYTAFVAVASV